MSRDYVRSILLINLDTNLHAHSPLALAVIARKNLEYVSFGRTFDFAEQQRGKVLLLRSFNFPNGVPLINPSVSLVPENLCPLTIAIQYSCCRAKCLAIT